MEEIWMAITGYEGLYEVSNLGRVRSVDRYTTGKVRVMKIKGKIMALSIDSAGFYKVNLCRDNKKQVVRVHRLVAEHFIEKPSNDPNICYVPLRKDGDKLNNRADNLYWEVDNIAYSDGGKLGCKVRWTNYYERENASNE